MKNWKLLLILLVSAAMLVLAFASCAEPVEKEVEKIVYVDNTPPTDPPPSAPEVKIISPYISGVNNVYNVGDKLFIQGNFPGNFWGEHNKYKGGDWGWNSGAVGAIIAFIGTASDLDSKVLTLATPFVYDLSVDAVAATTLEFTGAKFNAKSDDDTYFEMKWQEPNKKYAFFDNGELGFVNPGKIGSGLQYNELSNRKSNVKIDLPTGSGDRGNYLLKAVIELDTEATTDVWVAKWKSGDGTGKTGDDIDWPGFIVDVSTDDDYAALDDLSKDTIVEYAKLENVVPVTWTWTVTKIAGEDGTAGKATITKFQIDGLKNLKVTVLP